MMNFHAPIPRRLAALALLLAALPALGQNIIYDLPTCDSEFPIVRNYKEYIDIKYEVHYHGGPSTFDYMDRTNGLTYTIPLPLGYVHYVRDFEILDGKVYFCGSKFLADAEVGNQYTAMVGWFDIDSVFFQQGTVHIVNLPHNMQAVYPDSNQITISNFERMVVTMEDNAVHIIAVHPGYMSSGKNGIIADIWNDPAQGWVVEYSVDGDMDIAYHDLAVTDNYVVVVAHNSDGFHCVLGYPRPSYSASGTSIFEPLTFQPQKIYAYVAGSPDVGFCGSGMHIVATGDGDGFVTECTHHMFPYEQYDWRNVISWHGNLETPWQRIRFESISNNEIHRLAYGADCKSLCMVPSDNLGYLYLWPLGATSVNFKETGVSDIWMSVDYNKYKDRFMVSGKIYSQLEGLLLMLDVGGASCMSSYQTSAVAVSTEQWEQLIWRYVNRNTCEIHSYQVKSESSYMEVICD